MKKIYLTIIFIITAFCMALGLFINLFSYSSSNIVTSEDMSYQVDEIEFSNINIDMRAGNVKIVQGNDYNIKYDGTKKLQPTYDIQNNTLNIKQSNAIHIYNVRDANAELTITVPYNIDIDKLIANINAGNLKLNDVKANVLDAHVDMGNIDIDSCEFESVKADVNMGNFDIKDGEYQKAEVDVDMGNATFKISRDIEYQYDLNVDMGNIKVYGNSYSSRYNNVDGGEKVIKADVSMGNIKIKE